MSKARGLAALGNAYNDGALSNRNLIINGAMQVAQRGTSFTANGYGLDRWKTFNSGGTATLSQQTFASGDSPEVGLDTYVRIVRASPSGIYYFSQRVEDVRKSDGATLTLSFYGKASSATTVPCRITQEFGSGGSSGVNITAQNNNLTTSWQRFSVTFNMASLSGKTIGTGSYFDTVFDIPSTTATIDITGVQLEVGDTATPFEHRSYADELQRCQRYTYIIAGLGQYGAGSIWSASSAYISIDLPVSMRATPTLGSQSGTNFYRIYSGGEVFSIDDIEGYQDAGTGLSHFTFYASSHSMTVGRGAWLQGTSSSSRLIFDAEL
jgi:hypothetical protein